MAEIGRSWAARFVMRNAASLIEPIILHLAADRAKERHDAVTRLKAIMDGVSGDLHIEGDLANKLVQTFVKMMRIELKAFLLPREEASSDMDAMTSIQINKINQLMKDFKWLLALLQPSFPRTTVITALPDIYNFCLDVLESSLSLLYTEVLVLCRNYIFCHKTYLLEMREDQWNRFMDSIHAFLDDEGLQRYVTCALEDEIMTALFYMTLAMPEDIASWSENMAGVSDTVVCMLYWTLQKSRESSSLCILFRTLNFIMHELRIRDIGGYNNRLQQVLPIMLAFPLFKITAVLEEFYLFFLLNNIQPNMQLEIFAAAEVSKSRIRPIDLDPIRLYESLVGYFSRDREFTYLKGYLQYCLSLEFCHRYAPTSELQLEDALHVRATSVECLALFLFRAFVSSEYSLTRLRQAFESVAGEQRSWLTAMILARLQVEEASETELSELYSVCTNMLLKRSSAEQNCLILTKLLEINDRLVEKGPPFIILLEALSPVILTRPSLLFLKYLYGYTYRGLWWSLNAVESYQATCQSIISLFESNSDSRALLDNVISNAQDLAEVLGTPFNCMASRKRVDADYLKFGDTEALSLLSNEERILKTTRRVADFETCGDVSHLALFTRILTNFRSQLIDQIQVIGYASCKILLQNTYQVNAKEDNFATLCIQMLDMFLAAFGPIVDRLQWNPLYFKQRELQQILSVLKRVDEPSSCVSFAKNLIQSFEFFKFKNSSKQEFAATGNSPNSYLFVKPVAYCSHTHDKSILTEYLFVEILTTLACKFKFFDQAVWDNEARLFIDDFFVYLRSQFVKCLAASSIYLHLTGRVASALTLSVDEFADLLSSNIYRHDEQAVICMTRYLVSNLKQSPKSFTKLKPFIDSVLKRHLKWKLKAPAKSATLDLVIVLCEQKLLPVKDLFKFLLDPSPYAYDLWHEQYARLFTFVNPIDFKHKLLKDEEFWSKSSCIGEITTKFKLLVLSVKAGIIQFYPALAACLSQQTPFIGEFAASGISRFEMKKNFSDNLLKRLGERLLSDWIRRAKPIEAFPYPMFSDDLMTLMTNPMVFSQMLSSLDLNRAAELYDPTNDFLVSSFSRLVAMALFLYFSGKTDLTDTILSSLLRKKLGDKPFEALFRDNVIEIVHDVIEISLSHGRPDIVLSSLEHIATMFKYDSADEILSPAYMVHVVLLALDNILVDTDSCLQIISFVFEKCPSLSLEETVALHVLKSVSNSLARWYSEGYFHLFKSVMPAVQHHTDLGSLVSQVIAQLLDHEERCRLFLDAIPTSDPALRSLVVICMMVLSPSAMKTEFTNSDDLDTFCYALIEQASANMKWQILEVLHLENVLGKKSAMVGHKLLSMSQSIKPSTELHIALLKQAYAEEMETASNSSESLDILEEVVVILADQLSKAQPDKARLFLAALTNVLNTDGFCGPAFIKTLPSTIQSRIGFLQLSLARRRLLLPKYRPFETASFESLWQSDLPLNNWCSSVITALSSSYGRSPIWAKIGYVFSDEEAAMRLLPLVFDDCFFSDSEPQASLLGPIQEFLQSYEQGNSLNDKILKCIVPISERLLTRRKPGVLIDIDFKRLGSLLQDEPLKALYFFEMGLSGDKLQSLDRDRLESLYSSAGVKDYVGCFSKLTRAALIDTVLDSFLAPKTGRSFKEEEEKALWELQKWDITRIPEAVGTNSDSLDIFNVLRLISRNEGNKISDLITCILNRNPSPKDDMVRVIDAGAEFAHSSTVQLIAKGAKPVDLCLLSMQPSQRTNLFDASVKILSKAAASDDIECASKSLFLLDGLQIPELGLIAKGEKAKILWAKGAAEEAVDLMRLALESAPAGPILDSVLREYTATSYSLISEWIFQMRAESPSAIKEEYLDEALRVIGSAPSTSETLAYIYSTYAKFVDHLFDQMSGAENLGSREKLLKQSKQDLEALSKLGMESRDESTLRSIRELEKQYNADRIEFEAMCQTRTSFLLLAVENYLRCLQLVDKHDFAVFRVCSLWFQFYSRVPDLSQLIAGSIGKVPCHKFIPLIYQLAARAELSEVHSPDSAAFQETLERLLFRMVVKHPYHCLYQVLALKAGTVGGRSAPSKRKLVYSTESLEVRRAAAAAALVSKLKASDARVSRIVESIEALCAAYIELADVELPSDSKANVLIKFDSRWAIGKLMNAGRLSHPVAMPTKALAVDPSGQYAAVTTLTGFGAGFKVVGGINLPKIIECTGSDGRVYKQLVKGKDDVRQDAVMEQVFVLVDQMLRANEGTRNRGLGIRTYRIIPLHALAGLLEWVSDTVPLGEFVLPAHERYNPTDVKVREARNLMKGVWEDPKASSASKLVAYNELCSRFHPVLRHFFWETAKSPTDWWARRCHFVSSCAATSMLGYVVGLGDRHCQNILLDKCSGDMIQIDLNMIFELGKTLRVPERVPFRMTPDIVDGLGPAGTRGGFSKAAEAVLKLLRRDADTILMILEVFKHDPLYRWSLNPIKQARLASMNSIKGSGSEPSDDRTMAPEADRALLRVREKLLGMEEGGVQLSEAGQVRFLLLAAMSPENLSQMYIGWQPWV